MTVTATELKSNLGHYLDSVAAGQAEITITKNGREIARLSNPNMEKLAALKRLSLLMDGAPSAEAAYDAVKDSRLEDKYGEYFV